MALGRRARFNAEVDVYVERLAARWRESADPVDEARYLVERMRSGDLPRPRVELAAFVGHEASRSALGPAFNGLGVEDPTLLANDLWPWGKEACVTAAVAAADLALPLPAEGAVLDKRPRQAIEAAAAWVAGQSPARLEAAAAAAEAALMAAGAPTTRPGNDLERMPALAAHHTAAAAAAWPLPMAIKHAHRAIKYAADVCQQDGVPPSEVLDAISSALIVWALGPQHGSR